jgi:very-short-patch-repair endonuclease
MKDMRLLVTCSNNECKVKFLLSPSRVKNSKKNYHNLACYWKSIKGIVPWSKGKKITEKHRLNLSISHRGSTSKEELKKRGLTGLLKQQSMKRPTSIEKTVYDFLLLKGIIFERQKLINNKFLVDVYIPSSNLVIEVDGNYWHSLDRVMKKDKAENAYLGKCGFNLLRLSEEEINNGKFVERLVQ